MIKHLPGKGITYLTLSFPKAYVIIYYFPKDLKNAIIIKYQNPKKTVRVQIVERIILI